MREEIQRVTLDDPRVRMVDAQVNAAMNAGAVVGISAPSWCMMALLMISGQMASVSRSAAAEFLRALAAEAEKGWPEPSPELERRIAATDAFHDAAEKLMDEIAAASKKPLN